MEISKQQEEFLTKRKQLVHSWPLVGSILLVFLLGIVTWMYFHNPLLVNPFEVAAQVDRAALDPNVLILMAILFPVGMLVSFFILTVLVLLGFGVISNEKKYQLIIEELKGNSSPVDNDI